MQTLETRVEKLLTKHPAMSAQAASVKLGITKSWVSQLAKRIGFQLQWVKVK